jgi:2-phospho-L-lactate guanylyltransferase (CobY/MobA/RfbA family)
MTESVKHTALLLFARRPDREGQVKSLIEGNNERLWQILYQRTLATSAATGLPLVLIDEREQRGTTFGERLKHAFQDTFQQGYKRVILIGSDVPDLRPDHLLRAAEKLDHTDWVLGPDLRGGAYLIGCTEEAFYRNLTLDSLPWQSDRILLHFTGYLLRNAEIIGWLPTLADLNNAADLQRWLAIHRQLPWAQTILQLLSVDFVSTTLHRPLRSITIQSTHLLRGPPRVA